MSSVRTQGIVGPHDPTEVHTTDDLAAHRAEEFLQLALLDQQVRASGGAVYLRGLCAFCEQACSPLAVYCDADCRADHERELAALLRTGRAGKLARQRGEQAD